MNTERERVKIHLINSIRQCFLALGLGPQWSHEASVVGFTATYGNEGSWRLDWTRAPSGTGGGIWCNPSCTRSYKDAISVLGASDAWRNLTLLQPCSSAKFHHFSEGQALFLVLWSCSALWSCYKRHLPPLMPLQTWSGACPMQCMGKRVAGSYGGGGRVAFALPLRKPLYWLIMAFQNCRRKLDFHS